MLLLLIIVKSVEGVKRSKADCIVCGKKITERQLSNCYNKRLRRGKLFWSKNIELRASQL